MVQKLLLDGVRAQMQWVNTGMDSVKRYDCNNRFRAEATTIENFIGLFTNYSDWIFLPQSVKLRFQMEKFLRKLKQ
jgi:hypothetical protein